MESCYGWRTLGGARGRGGGSLGGRRVGHVRSGVVGSGEFGVGMGWRPIDYDEPVGGGAGGGGAEHGGGPHQTVRYRCRARLARGGRIVFDRIPLLQTQHQPTFPPPPPTAAAAAAAQQQENTAAASSAMPPPTAPAPPGQHLHLHHPHPPSYHPLPAESITVALSAAPSLGPHLDKYPTCDLQAGDVFKYPTKFAEILKIDDGEDEVVERDPAADSDPDPLLVLPSKPRPPETDSVALLRFQLRV